MQLFQIHYHHLRGDHAMLGLFELTNIVILQMSAANFALRSNIGIGTAGVNDLLVVDFVLCEP